MYEIEEPTRRDFTRSMGCDRVSGRCNVLGALLYHLLILKHLGYSAAMFLGVPAVLAFVLAMTPKSKSVTGGILKGITLALLLIAPFLAGEGASWHLLCRTTFRL